ncbi:MAG: DUF4433 domain-containing protein [Bradyrhizobiaceae bacterium]|nr:DUF4433 domain-containing protein [Bradyrhizobiaceae bacterium]
MSHSPEQPKIYHIVHIDNLPSIVSDGFLWPDSVMVERRSGAVIGNNEIKADRLHLPVSCHPGTTVGQFVPFYFCPRSVMLYVISKRNHPNVAYRDGQEPVIHLEADLKRAVEWANRRGRRWTFTDINAANRAADFFADLDDLTNLDWAAINTHNWKACRDHKMAEFLMQDQFPWELVERIGVFSEPIGAQVIRAFAEANHRPPVNVKRAWYY